MKLPSGWHKRIAKVLETFCGEAAVLLLVFPVLDEFIQHGRTGVSSRFIAASLIGSAVALSIALLIAVFVHEEDH